MNTPDPHAPLDPPPDLPHGLLPTIAQALASALGSQILLMAVLDLDQQATELIRRTTALCGSMALIDQMLLWVDTYLGLAGYKCPCPDHQHDEPRTVALAFVDIDTGETSDTDDVPPEVRWAGRVISARAVGDVDTQAALISSLPRDAALQGRHVLALLQTVACQLRVLAGKEGPVPGV